MLKIKSKVYLRSVKFSKEIFRLTKLFDKHPRYFDAIRQLNRAVTSVSANLMEAQSARSKKEFVSIHMIALGEAKEVFHWLDVLEDSKANNNIDLFRLKDENVQIIRMISAIITTTKQKYNL
jgi:four helix bundle protein